MPLNLFYIRDNKASITNQEFLLVRREKKGFTTFD